jgi:hypothetical protein
MALLFEPVVASITTFIDWALTIVSVMIIWYVIKFFLVEPPTKADKVAAEAADKEKGQKMRDWLTGKAKEQKGKDAKKRRENELKPAKAHLVEAIGNGEDLVSSFSGYDKGASLAQAKTHLRDLRSNLKMAVHNLRHVRRQADGDSLKLLDSLYKNSGVALSKAKDLELPDRDSENWTKDVNDLVKAVKEVRRITGAVLEVLDKYIQKMHHDAVAEESYEKTDRVAREKTAHKEAVQTQAESTQSSTTQQATQQAKKKVTKKLAAKKKAKAKAVGVVRKKKS